jgi:hypothetical protein
VPPLALDQPRNLRRGVLAPAELAGRTRLDESAVVDDSHTVRERLSLFQVMGGEQHARPLLGEVAHQVPERSPCLGVKAGGRFVQEQQFGTADYAERHIEAPALSARERPYPGISLGREAYPLDHVCWVSRRGVEAREVTHGLAHR